MSAHSLRGVVFCGSGARVTVSLTVAFYRARKSIVPACGIFVRAWPCRFIWNFPARVGCALVCRSGVRNPEVTTYWSVSADVPPSQSLLSLVRWLLEMGVSRDRDIPLSPNLLVAVREYWRWKKPRGYLFPSTPGQRGVEQPMSDKVVWWTSSIDLECDEFIPQGISCLPLRSCFCEVSKACRENWRKAIN